MMAPETAPGRQSGKVTNQKVRAGPAPRSAEACSNAVSIFASALPTESTTKGSNM